MLVNDLNVAMPLLTLQTLQDEFLAGTMIDCQFNVIQIVVRPRRNAPKVLVKLFMVTYVFIIVLLGLFCNEKISEKTS